MHKMYYSYAIKDAQLGVYMPQDDSGYWKPVVVTHDERGRKVAVSTHQESVFFFADQMSGWCDGLYRMIPSAEYCDA